MDKKISITKKLLGITELWKKTKGDSEIRVAILDGPVDLNHSALRKANLISLDNTIKKNIRSSHGTFVSSLIFANHKSGILGIAPDCFGITKSIYREDNNGNLNSCSQSDIAQGILAALEQNADIINISGGEKLNPKDTIITPLANALEQCEKRGVLVIAATGNEGNDSIHVPASYPTVLAVGSINNEGLPSNFSNWSNVFPKTGIVAPGEHIMGATTNGENEKAIAQGTSFSTALVSGVAALLASFQKQQGIKKDLLHIRKTLLASVTSCSNKEDINCARIMNGRLNITNAINTILNDVNNASLSRTLDKPEVKTIKNTSTPNHSNTTKKTQKFLTLINTNMENQTEVTPLSETNDSINEKVNLATPSSTEETALIPQEIKHNATPSVVKAASSESSSQVTPSETSMTYNPATNPGGYPTFKNCQLVNAIGQPSYNFGTQNNLDTFNSLMKSWYNNLPDGTLKDSLTDSPHDHRSMVAFLVYQTKEGKPNALMSSQLIWLLNMNTSPIYAISPMQANFSPFIYLIMEQFLAENVGINIELYSKYTLDLYNHTTDPSDPLPENMFIENKKEDDLMRMVLPGYISGESKLMNGNYINCVTPVAFGLKNWTLNALIDSLEIEEPAQIKQLKSILNRLYVSTLNKGQSPEDRALNHSLYNIIQLSEIIKEVTVENLQLSGYRVVPSKISRQNSIEREVQLTFFDPQNTNKASITYSMEIDISGVTPVLIGETQKWYAPVSVTSV